MAHQEVHNGGAAPAIEKAAVVFTAVKPQLLIEAPKANDALVFYKAAFGAEELSRSMHPKRKADQEIPLILSAQLKLGSSVFLVSDVTTDEPNAPVKKADGGSGGCVLCLETEDVEGAVAKAVTAGAVKEEKEEEIAASGERACCGGRVVKVKDPYGFVWLICSPTPPVVVGKKCDDVEA